MRIYTKTGDSGQTSLLGGSRIAKNACRVECYGTIDEANAALGIARAVCKAEDMKEKIFTIQSRMHMLGSQLAADEKGRAMLKNKINETDISFLEKIIDDYIAEYGPLKSFSTPGDNLTAAHLHLARTIIRRAERHMTALEDCCPLLAAYTNRLSDAVFVMAKEAESRNI